jgi:hypothetical protein
MAGFLGVVPQWRRRRMVGLSLRLSIRVCWSACQSNPMRRNTAPRAVPPADFPLVTRPRTAMAASAVSLAETQDDCAGVQTGATVRRRWLDGTRGVGGRFLNAA